MPKRLTQEEYIERCKAKHGDKYDYSKINYVNNSSKVCITCSEHGEFWIRAADFERGRGCSVCSGVKKLDNISFAQKAKEKYGDKYDYSKVEYKNNKTKVCIICHEVDKYGKEHGEFWQRPNDHLSGYECSKCKNKYSPTTEEWVEHAQKIHGDKYDYSKAHYVNAKSLITIICPKHGEFKQTSINHIYGKCECPSCNSDSKSKMEENIYLLLEEHNIRNERQKTFEWLKHKNHLYLDFYLPEYNIAIEVQGEQHFRPIEKFGGEEFYILQKDRDTTKEKLCSSHNIKLFYITKRNYNIDGILSYIKNNGTTNKKE